MGTLNAFLIAGWLCSFIQSQAVAGPLDVSLVQLIANPKEHDGKVVRVIGYVRLEFEGNAIYLHEDDDKHAIHRNGLWLSITDDIRKNAKEFDKKYILVEGTFDATMKGHMGLWSGSIGKISRFQVWSEGDGRRK
jgi:hypothetical protein